ncbi:MAG: hypothetical protein Q4E01_00660 [Actinomycetaceae bacterium]|nr:hypothetical protein [Actinomycetaceae bacterium]
MIWILQLPILVAMLATVLLPGWMWLRVLSYWLPDKHVGTLVQIGIAPVVSFGMIAILANALPAMGVTWSASSGVTILMLIAVAGWLADMWVRRGRRRVWLGMAPWNWDWPLIGTLTGAFMLAALPLLVFADPRNPLQQWDPSFHLNGVWQMVQHGDSSIYGVSGNFSVMGEAHSYYPDVWHAFVALFATPSTIAQTANTSSLAIIVWWIVGMAAFAQYLWVNRAMTLTAGVLSSLPLSFPADFVSMYAQWPNSTSMALLPALLTLSWVVGNAWVRAMFGAGRIGIAVAWTFTFALAALGAVAVHPISFFNALVFVLVPLGAAMFRLMRSARRSNRTGLLVLLGAATVVALAVVAFAFFNPRTLGVASFERTRSILDALTRPFVPVPPFPLTVGFVLAIAVLLALIGLGLWRAFGTSLYKTKWLVGTWALFALLVFLAYAPDFGLQILTGPWYSDPRRLMGAMQVVVVLLATLATAQVATWIRSRKLVHEALPVLLVVALSGVGAIDARAMAVRAGYDPEALGPAGMASAEQLDLFRSAESILPEDALVVGDPSVGTVYFQSLGNRRVVFPALSNSDVDKGVRELMTTFNSIHEDPSVCETLNRIGATHFYEGTDSPYYKRMRSELRPGFYGVDTSTDFTKVASVEGGTLYEITACR